MNSPVGVINYLYYLVIEESKKRKADEEAKEKKKQEEERRKNIRARYQPRNIPMNPRNPMESNKAVTPPPGGITWEDIEDEMVP